jgi:glycosyltransferase involved in cell wall biosynthesis
MGGALHETGEDAALRRSADAEPRCLRIVTLPNTRQSDRFTSYVPEQGPNPSLPYRYLRENGIDLQIRDRLKFPMNPFERLDILYAGIDPLRALRVLLLDRRVDAVLCGFENTALPIVALRRIFRFAPPVFLMEVSHRGWRPRDTVLDFVLPRVDQVLALTDASKCYVESAYDLKRPAIVVNGPGVAIDETFYRPDAEPSGPAYANGNYVLSVGDDHTRDYDLLVTACASLDISLVIRTSRPIRIPPQMQDRVKLIPDRLSFREFRDLYLDARLLVLPLREADNPGGITTLFEGMAMAKPIVCSDTGATRDFITDRENGLLVPPGDADALRAAMTHLIRAPDEAAALGRAARRQMEENFTVRRRAERIAAAIKQALPSIQAPPSR